MFINNGLYLNAASIFCVSVSNELKLPASKVLPVGDH